jgi:hypothetical protein
MLVAAAQRRRLTPAAVVAAASRVLAKRCRAGEHLVSVSCAAAAASAMVACKKPCNDATPPSVDVPMQIVDERTDMNAEPSAPHGPAAIDLPTVLAAIQMTDELFQPLAAVGFDPYRSSSVFVSSLNSQALSRDSEALEAPSLLSMRSALSPDDNPESDDDNDDDDDDDDMDEDPPQDDDMDEDDHNGGDDGGDGDDDEHNDLDEHDRNHSEKSWVVWSTSSAETQAVG